MVEHVNFPQRITLELTNRCNLLCSFCPRHLFDMQLGDMEEALFYKIIDECMKHLPITLVMFFRGEPLLYPKLSQYIRYAKDHGISPIQLASNGMQLTEDVADDLLCSSLDFISFSFDTDDEALYLTGRKNGDFHTTKKNILRFIEKAGQLKAQGKKVPEIQISTVDIDVYREKQEDFIRFWTQYADRVRVYEEHSSDGNLGSIRSINNSPVPERKICQKLLSDMVIYHDGTVAMCNHDWNNQMMLGNVKHDTIQSIWNGEAYSHIRTQQENGSFDTGICQNCDHWQVYYLDERQIGKLYTKGSMI